MVHAQELSPTGQQLVRRFVLFRAGFNAVFAISSVFVILHVIDLVGYANASYLFAVLFFAQALTDYPSGVLSDWIGHKWVFTLSNILFSLGFGMLGIADGMALLLIAFALIGLGFGQASGVVQSWYDNNFRVIASTEDVDRKIYKDVQGQVIKLEMLSAGISFLVGGLLSTVLPSGRAVVFFMQACAFVLLAVFAIRKMNNLAEVQLASREDVGFLRMMRDGVAVAFASKFVLLLTVGLILIDAVTMTWFTMLLFPVYNGYTGTDIGVAVLRFILFIASALLAGVAGNISKNLDAKKWFPRSFLIGDVSFFFLVGALVYFFPIENEFMPLALLFLITLFISIDVGVHLGYILRQSIFLDAIPDANRNSYYSLLPTFVAVLSVPIILMTGIVVEQISFAAGIFSLSGLMVVGYLVISFGMRYYIAPADAQSPQVDAEIIEVAS